ncbi:MAG: nickel-dependent lactate racemase [Verrucomicrobiota bacterium]
MTKPIQLAYGPTGLIINLPAHAEVVRSRHLPGVGDEPAAIRAALRQPIQSAPLAENVRAGNKVVIVHTDITRATPNDRILPVLLAELESAGISRSDITLINALGTHRPQTDAELRQMLGDKIVDNYRCLQHDANDAANLVSLGKTSRGHPVRVSRHFLNADVRILTGFIEPHFFAGFSGGPKGVLPSIAGAESVQSNHGYDMIGNPNATWGVTSGNPIWEEMREVALRTKPTFILNVTLNSAREITGVFAGDLLAAHAAGCAFVKEHAMAAVVAPFDIVITTNSGYPLDQNLYQCVKGLSAANRIVRDGGTIIIAAACADGLPEGGRFVELLEEAGSPQAALDMLAQPGFSQPDQWQVQIQATIQLRADVYVRSDGLTDAQIRRTLLQPCHSIEATVTDIEAKLGRPATICVLPEGPQTIAYVR